jgi:hypothetical protein
LVYDSNANLINVEQFQKLIAEKGESEVLY